VRDLTVGPTAATMRVDAADHAATEPYLMLFYSRVAANSTLDPDEWERTRLAGERRPFSLEPLMDDKPASDTVRVRGLLEHPLSREVRLLLRNSRSLDQEREGDCDPSERPRRV